jgi:hypothetical protein
MGQFTNLQNILNNTISPEYHAQVFVPGVPPIISGPRVDSISSCNYSSIADELLSTFHPLIGTNSNAKRFRQTHLTYASATSAALPTNTTASTLTSTIDIDSLYERLSLQFSQQISDTQGPNLDITSLEQQVQQTSQEIIIIKDTLKGKIAAVTTSVNNLLEKVDNQHNELSQTVRTLTTTIDCQNAVIAKIQQDVKIGMEALTMKMTHTFSSPSARSINAATSSFRHHSTAG